MPQAKTGFVFRSVLGTPEMAKHLERKFPEMSWRMGDSDQYRYYYVEGRRHDGVRVKIMPEDDLADDEYYLGVYFDEMPQWPTVKEELAIAEKIHAEILPVVQGVRRPS